MRHSCLLPLQIVTRTTPVKRGLLHEPRVPEDCPAEVRTLIADCTKLIAADRPDTKVGQLLRAQDCTSHGLCLCVAFALAHACAPFAWQGASTDGACQLTTWQLSFVLQRVFDRLKASAAAHRALCGAADAPPGAAHRCRGDPPRRGRPDRSGRGVRVTLLQVLQVLPQLGP